MAFGQRINPYNAPMQSVRTVAGRHFLTAEYYVELRWGMAYGQDWAWVRVTRLASAVGYYPNIAGFLKAGTLIRVSGIKHRVSTGGCTDAYSFGPSTSRKNYAAVFGGGAAYNIGTQAPHPHYKNSGGFTLNT